MKYCRKCNVKVNTGIQKCPLCSMVLSVEKTSDIIESNQNNTNAADKDVEKYPRPKEGNTDKYNFVFRLFFFITVVIGSTCLLINIFTFSGVLWSMYVIGTMLYIWTTVAYPLFVKRKIGHIIVITTISTSIYLYSLELATRTKGWGLSYVTPLLFIASTLMITFIIFLRRLKWREYSIYQTIMVILGFLPVIFWVTGLVTPIWPSVLSAFYSFLTLTGMFIFADKKYKNELIKRFHL